MLRGLLVLAGAAAASAFSVPPRCLGLRGGSRACGTTGATKLSMADPKLVYFDARGVVEPTRLLLAAAGVKYEDKRYAVDMTTKPPSAPEFNADKESGALAVNMGRAPILEVDGAQIGQSHAIARMLARRHGMMGANDVQAAQIDCVYEHVRDIKDAWVKVRINPSLDEDAKKAAADKYLTQDLGEWCTKLERSLGAFAGAPECAVGDTMSLADVAIYACLTCYFPADKSKEVADAYAACPKMSAIVKAVGANKGIQSWEKERPVTFM